MLTALLTAAAAILVAVIWIGACLLPLCMVWGLWRLLSTARPPASEATPDPIATEHDALIAECQALMAESRGLQAARR